MKLGIACLIFAAFVLVGIGYLISQGVEGFGGIGRLIVGGLSSLWLLSYGISRIRSHEPKQNH